MDLGLSNKVAVITGGSVGIGLAVAEGKRLGSPEELANFFVFLCSEKASYSVGSTYFVDGGMLKSL